MILGVVLRHRAEGYKRGGTVIRAEIELTEEQDRRLEELRAARHVPKEELVRQAVDILLARSVLPPHRW